MKNTHIKSVFVGALLATGIILGVAATTSSSSSQEWLVERAQVLEEQRYLSANAVKTPKGSVFFPFHSKDGWEPFAYQPRSGTQPAAVLYRKRIQ